MTQNIFPITYFKDQEVFIQNIKKLCNKELNPNLKKWEKDELFPNSVFTTLGKEGYLGLLLPEKYGGVDGDYKLAGAWCETFGEVCAVGMTVGVNMHSLVVSHALSMYGSKSMKDKYLPSAVLGEKIGAYAFTEPGAGSDLQSISTKAIKKDNKWIINGSKTFITNATRDGFLLVLTKTKWDAKPYEFTTFVVDANNPGFRVSSKLDKLGWRSSDTAELVFDNVEVDDSAILGKIGQGWSLAMKNLNWERLMLVLTTLGAVKQCYSECLEYVKDRKAFNQRVIDFDYSKMLLNKMYLKIKQGEALSYKALDDFCDGKDCRLLVALAKRKVCDDAVWIADKSIQFHGGYGYTKEYNPERWWRDLRLMPIGGGTSEIMAQVASKCIGF